MHLIRVRTALVAVSEWSALWLLWLLFSGSLDAEECLAGFAAAAIATLALEVAKRAKPICFRPPLRAAAEAWRIPGLILQGTWILCAELVRRMRGRRSRAGFGLAPFNAAGRDGNPVGKRALAILYGTLPPNFLIIGVDTKTKRMLFHQIRKDSVPRIIREIESA